MLIELSLLPPAIAEQILQVQHGQSVQFTHNGQVVANVSQPKNTFLDFYINTPFDVADIDIPEFDRKNPPPKFDDPFADD
ncbi:MAG: hypothetical protein Q4A69_09760 [Moraxella sp.]|nr:hypothetical protein [Moraxella sp.]